MSDAPEPDAAADAVPEAGPGGAADVPGGSRPEPEDRKSVV